MRDLVVPGVDRVERTDARRNMAMDMEAELVRRRDASRQPRRIQRAVELHAGEAVRLGLGDKCDGLGLAGGDVCDLRGIRTLAVDERRRIHVRKQQLARGLAVASIDGLQVVVARIA